MNPAEIVVNVVKGLAAAWAEYQATRALDEAAAVARFRAKVSAEVAACLADEAKMDAAKAASVAEALRMMAGRTQG